MVRQHKQCPACSDQAGPDSEGFLPSHPLPCGLGQVPPRLLLACRGSDTMPQDLPDAPHGVQGEPLLPGAGQGCAFSLGSPGKMRGSGCGSRCAPEGGSLRGELSSLFMSRSSSFCASADWRRDSHCCMDPRDKGLMWGPRPNWSLRTHRKWPLAWAGVGLAI